MRGVHPPSSAPVLARVLVVLARRHFKQFETDKAHFMKGTLSNRVRLAVSWRHRRFAELLARRERGGCAAALAAALSAASPGRAPDLWADLPTLQPRLLFVAGALDAKFAALAARMAAAAPGTGCGGVEGGAGTGLAGLGGAAAARSGSGHGNAGTGAGVGCPSVRTRAGVRVVEGSGHAVHLEQPAALARVLAAFLDGFDIHKEA